MATALEMIRAGVAKQAAETGGARIENNEEQTNKGVGDVHTAPKDRKPGTLDARWGDHPPVSKNGDQAVFGTAAEREAKDGRNEMIERLFDSPKSSASAEQALMSQNFTGAADGHPHSPLLQRGRVKTAADETLTDKVRKVIGFF
jgi:hypothetical protein